MTMPAGLRFTLDSLSAFDRFLPSSVRARPADLRAGRRLAMLAAIAGACTPLLILMYHLLGDDGTGRIVLAGGMVMLISPFTLSMGIGMARARDLFIGALYVLQVWLALKLGGLGAPTIHWFLLCPVIAVLLGGARAGLGWGGLVSLTVVAIFTLERGSGKLVAHRMADQQVLSLVSILGLFALVTIIVLMFLADSSAAHSAAGADPASPAPQQQSPGARH
jgi:hypothetical protein